MLKKWHRRSFLRSSLVAALPFQQLANAHAATNADATNADATNADATNADATNAGVSAETKSRQLGLLYGGLIGDALGGPVEFSEASAEEKQLCDARSWPDSRQLDEAELNRLAESVPMLGYELLRPDSAPYGPWRNFAPAGTLTDDSRHKMILLHAIRLAAKTRTSLTSKHIAEAFLKFAPTQTASANGDSQTLGTPSELELAALDEEGFREYRYASRWLLGDRDPKRARPIERLWAGIANCSGQMMFPPLAIAFPGKSKQCYEATFQLDFIDAPAARDIASALVAGLSAALGPNADAIAPGERWELLLKTIRETDPYEFAEVPFAGRPLNKLLDQAEEFVRRADGKPRRLYELLEREGKPVYWWDAHFTLLVPLCMIQFCNFNSQAAMHLTLDFGHDTDSYAQVLGCMIGACEGIDAFPISFQDAVKSTLANEYGEDVEQWIPLLENVAV